METLASLALGVLIVTIIGTVYGVGYWLDQRFGLKTLKWLNGEAQTFFADASQSPHADAEKHSETTELRERIQVLEQLVTEPAYELNKKINQL